jgi:DNA-binding GntR family transcriptional regulator
MTDFSMKVVRQPPPLRTQVRELLRSAIVEMHFLPGERLVERKLCEMAGVSRAVIREVLRELEAEGLVQIVPNRGPVVAGNIELEEARGLYETRAVLEALAGRSFVLNATASDLEALRAAFAEFDQASAVSPVDARVVLRSKAKFYAILLQGARNQTTLNVLRSLHDRITALRALTLGSPGRIAETRAEVRQIMVAIEAGDAAGAWDACIAHVRNAGRLALAILERQRAKKNDQQEEKESLMKAPQLFEAAAGPKASASKRRTA